MVIGISSAELFAPNITVRERVAFEMVKALQRADSTNQYVIFSKYSTPAGFSFAENFRFEQISSLGNGLGDQFALPKALYRNGCEVLLNLGFTGPLGLKIPHLYLLPSFWGSLIWDKLYGGSYFREDKQSFYRRYVSKRLINQCTKLILSSHYEKENLVQRFFSSINPRKLAVVQAGISKEQDLEVAKSQYKALCERYSLPEKYVLAIENSNSLSNIQSTLRGYKRMVDVLMVKTPIVIVGADEALVKATLGEDWLKANSEKLFLLNKLNEMEKALLFTGAQAYIAPAFYDKWCLHILDAISYGVPIVTSIQSSLSEVANGAAILVDPKNEVEISEAGRLILIDKKCLQGLAKKGLERATVYQWENTAQKLLALLQEYQH